MNAPPKPLERPYGTLKLTTRMGPLTVDILDGELERVRQVLLDDTCSVELPAGAYALRARTPAGELHTRHSTVGAGQGSVLFARPPPDRFIAPAPGRPDPHGGDIDRVVLALQRVELRLWQRKAPDAPWARVEPDAPRHHVDRDALQIHLGLAADTVPTFIEVCPPDAPRILVALPVWGAVPSIEVVPRPDGGFRVEIGLNDPQRHLLRILRDHTVDAATFLESHLGRAERFLARKAEDPFAAALGAYVLLRCRALERLHDWTQNLVDWFWLPDGAIIRAWHLILSGAPPGESLRWIAETVRRGPPIFSEGIRLLRDALALAGDPAAEQALHVALRSWRPDEELSTFLDADPAAIAAALGKAAPTGVAPPWG